MENKRRLGKSNLMLSPVGLGCWQFDSKGYFEKPSGAVIQGIVNTSVKSGVNWFDTAERYGNSEQMLSTVLYYFKTPGSEINIATKWWPMFRTAKNISKTIHDRINNLHPYPISLYQVHNPLSFSSIEKQMQEMSLLWIKGMIKNVGVCNFSAKQMRIAQDVLSWWGIPLASNQVRYNLIDRGIETNGVLDTAKELGISIIASSPLAQGILTGKFHKNPEKLDGVGLRKHSDKFNLTELKKCGKLISLIGVLAVKYDVTSSQIALNWLINKGVFVIPGATTVKQAEENAGSMNFTLSKLDMEMLDRESKIFT
jgi:aryl-alcohol dehydrogenase-like predicted oxidoreductase